MKKSRSIFTKLRIILLVTIIGFSIVIFVVFGIFYRRMVVNDNIQNACYQDRILAQTIETRINQTEDTCNILIISLNEFMTDFYLNEEKYPEVSGATQQRIYRCMLDTFSVFREVNQIMIVWKNGVTYYENRAENYAMDNDGKALIAELDSKQVDRYGNWIKSLETKTKLTGDDPYYAKQYFYFRNEFKATGYIVLSVGNIFDSVKNSSSERRCYLLDENRSVVICPDEDKEISFAELESQNNQYLNETVLSNGWILVSVTNLSKATEVLSQSIQAVLFGCFVVFVLMLFVVNCLLKRIVDPIRFLTQHMSNIGEQLIMPVDVRSQNDEIGGLIRQFNYMANRNRELVNLLIEEKKQQEELKFALLQSQIKPHFLYNSLDTIYCLAMMNRNEEAGNMTKLLADYYRHILNHGMDFVLLYEELKQTDNYLKIQQIRYKEVLEYRISLDSYVDNIRIPKLTLQPLVENAIYHGIKPMGKNGKLRISITQKEHKIYIRVSDNGKGMSKQEFDTILSRKAETTGYGLKNVVDRLKLFYGDACSVELEEAKIGTTILIIIDVEEEAT